jgi:hypothetical protein
MPVRDKVVVPAIILDSHKDAENRASTDVKLLGKFSYSMDKVKLVIRDVAAEELPNVSWNGKNDVYVRLQIGTWITETAVSWGAGKNSTWANVNIEHLLELQDEMAPIEELELSAQVFHKNISRKDQLIGEGKVSLSLIEINIPVDPETASAIKEHEECERKEKEIQARPTWFKDEEVLEAVPKLPAQDVVIDMFMPPGMQKPRLRGRVALRVWAEYAVTEDVEAPPSENKEVLNNTAANSVILPLFEGFDNNKTSPRRRESKANFLLPMEPSKFDYSSNMSSLQSSPRDVLGSRLMVTPGFDLKNAIIHASPELSRSSTPVTDMSYSIPPAPKRTLSGKLSSGTPALIKGSSARSLVSVHSQLDIAGPSVMKPSIASAEMLSSVTASRLQGTGHLPCPDAYRVIDEAFAAGIRCESSILALKFDEVVQVVDALGYTIDLNLNRQHFERMGLPPPAQGELQGQVLPLNKESMVHLPMLSPAPLAAVLTKFISDHKLCRAALSSSFSVSKENAEICMNNLRTLVEGNWLKARFMILVVCNRTDPGSGRPENWLCKWVQRLVKILQLPGNLFQTCNGHDFLNYSKESLSTTEVPSLLQYRLLIYQHTLRLVEQWWDRGFRPNDHYVNSTAIKAGLDFAGRGKYNGSRTASGPDSEKKAAKGRWSPLDSVVPSKSKTFGASRSSTLRWGCLAEDIYDETSVEGSTSLTAIKSLSVSRSPHNKIFVEIADFHSLLQAWVPLNRAYGWGVSVEVLSGFAAKFSGAVGYLTLTDPPHSPQQHTYAPETNLGKHLNVRECRWVGFAHTNASSSPEVDYTDIISLLSFERAQSPIIQEAVTGEDAILVPLKCLRSVYSAVSASQAAVFKPGCLANLPASDVVIGKVARVANDLQLSRACERYSWWDRPPQEILVRMADQKCEIVSVTELQAKGRVGVRVLCSESADNTDGVELIDALPLEALFEYEELEEKDTKIHQGTKLTRSASDGKISLSDKPKKLKRKKSKSVKRRTSADADTRVLFKISEPKETAVHGGFVDNVLLSTKQSTSSLQACQSSDTFENHRIKDGAATETSVISPVAMQAPQPSSMAPKYAAKLREVVEKSSDVREDYENSDLPIVGGTESRSAHSTPVRKGKTNGIDRADDTGAPLPFAGRTFFRPDSTALRQKESQISTLKRSPEASLAPPETSEPTSPYSWMKGMVNYSLQDKPVSAPRVVVEKNSPVTMSHLVSAETGDVDNVADESHSPRLNIATQLLQLDSPNGHNDAAGRFPANQAKTTIKIRKNPQPWKPTSTQVHVDPSAINEKDYPQMTSNTATDLLSGFTVTGRPIVDSKGMSDHNPADENLGKPLVSDEADHNRAGRLKLNSKKKPVAKAWAAADEDSILPVIGAEQPFGLMFSPPEVESSATENQQRKPENSKAAKKSRPASANATIKRQDEYQDTVKGDAVLNFGLNFEPPALLEAQHHRQTKKKDSSADKDRRRPGQSEGDEAAGVNFNPPGNHHGSSTYATQVVAPTRPKSASGSGRLTARKTTRTPDAPTDAPIIPQEDSHFTIEQQRLLRRETQRNDKELAALDEKLNGKLKSAGVKDKITV